eukprot:CAMPEP_0197830632 /NCGR_PEP_ID=MMETSP1437-20131217/7240_1 /TAXON_ID=49252 ORGANISM="Eucampia antarctica, Strain CCMP1452" /NCGR_SAMPLE_ID=MMETSP1437 /ASSEMBLY_ACC=CAM_ASM_001096 /LENGTH=145 /DNA_ID=CAMNT_0043433147 /DNA_START=99 /DNA_END=533 /DNA_ORIENTATION=-
MKLVPSLIPCLFLALGQSLVVTQAFISPALPGIKTSNRNASLLWMSTTTNKPSRFRFPTKASETTDYDLVVKSAFIRHVVLETPDMLDLAMKTYLKGSSSLSSKDNEDDPFGAMAKDISACVKSRSEGGKIGWIDNPFHPNNTNN